MSKSSGNRVRVEDWLVRDTKNRYNVGGKRVAKKVVVRDSAGRFHGATNFRGSLLR